MIKRGKETAAMIFFVLCLVFCALVGHIRRRRHCFRPVRPSVRPSVRVSVIIYELVWTRCLSFTNHVREFHKIYKLSAVGEKDELTRCWDQKVKGQSHGNKRSKIRLWTQYLKNQIRNIGAVRDKDDLTKMNWLNFEVT